MIVRCPRCARHIDTADSPAGARVRCPCGQMLRLPEGPLAAGKLACPGCGAGLDPDTLERCAHCGREIRLTLCPDCFGIALTEDVHCPHCGADLAGAQRERLGASASECPYCAVALEVERVSGCEIERCPRCQGLWIERQAVEAIVRQKVERGLARAQIDREVLPVIQVEPDNRPYKPCPECGRLMLRRQFGRYSGVIVDVCQACGTWFDRDELSRIIAFLEAGCLDRAARKEQAEMRRQLLRGKTGEFVETKTRDAERALLDRALGAAARLLLG
ncbi:MAG: zf-TFIIB domain-containing protein [Deltaproteobacteria bacterium]|nr:zf-TFIIB domain-containing protein [Deltaproteobacteria bacterium]